MKARIIFSAIFLLLDIYFSYAHTEKLTDTLDQSTVTASARIENISGSKSAPVTRIFMKKIEREKIMTYKDLSAAVPNLFIPEYGSKMTSSIYVRGLGARIDNPVMGLYIDGVGYLNKNNFDTDLFDIRSMEVFRGPQGTLFGRNTIGGIISISTLSPLVYQGTRISAGYGNGNTLNTRISHYMKLSDDAGIGIGGYYSHSDGFFRNGYVDSHPEWTEKYHSGSWSDPALCDWYDEAGGRVRAVWRQSENVTFDNTFSAGWIRQGGFPYAPAGGETAYNDYCGYTRLNIVEGLNYSIKHEGLDISGTTSWQYSKDRMDMDQDYLPLSYFTLVQAQNEHSLTQDLTFRPAARKESGWDWISGVSLLYTYNAMSAPVTFKKDGIDELILKNANSGIGVMFPGEEIRIAQDSFVISSDFVTHTAGAAAFHTSYYRTGNWTFEGGLRLDYEYNNFRYASATAIDYLFTMTMDSYRKLESAMKGREHLHFFEVLPRIAANYDAGDWSAYASVSKGHKAGGFNTQLFSDILQNRMMEDMMDDLGVHFGDTSFGEYSVSEVITYKPEKCWNFELGASGKCTFGESSLSGNATVFLVETFDQQLTVFPKKGTGRMMTNAGRSRSIGAELSGSFTYRGLSLDMNYGLTDARFVAYDNGKEDYSGKYVPYIPQNTLYASLSWSIPIASAILTGIDLNVNAKAFGRIYWDEANTVSQPFYALPGASAKFIFRDFSIELWGKNLSSTEYDTFYFVSIGNTFLQKGRPLQFGITLNLEI